MSTTEAGVLIMGLLVLVAVVYALRFKQRAKVKMKGPAGTTLDLDASNDPAPAVRAEGVKSRSGGLVAEDGTGRGVDVKNIEVEKDVNLTSGTSGPKA